jgi:hypothetical protein
MTVDGFDGATAVAVAVDAGAGRPRRRTWSLAEEVTGGASSADGGACQGPDRCGEHCGGSVPARDYDDCLNLRCLHLPAVFASFFYSSFVCGRGGKGER